MQLGKTLVGAIIGALLGVGLLVAVYMLFQKDPIWFSIVVAILTGMGVRMMVSTSGHASYLRGAITGVLALGAYLGGWFLVAALAKANAAKANTAPPIASAQPPAVTEQAEGTGESPVAEAPSPAVTGKVRPTDGTAMQKAPPPKGFSTLDFIFLCVAALVAYELGRGTGAAPPVTEPTEEPEMPPGTHPDA